MACVDGYPVKYFFFSYALAFILTSCINVDVRINAGRHKKKETVWSFTPTLDRSNILVDYVPGPFFYLDIS